MKRPIFALALGAAIASSGAPGMAQSGSPASGNPTADRIAQATFDAIRAGKSRAAVQGFFGPNSLVAAKSTELQLLASNIDSTIAIYGPMAGCELVERDTRGSMVERRLYICSHERFATRWILLFARTSAGWTGANLSYDDKIANHMAD